MTKPLAPTLLCLAALAAAGTGPAAAVVAGPTHARIVIDSRDPPDVGFNDTTPVAPVGGNPGTTLGEQRMNVYQHVARAWARQLPPGPPIRVAATWDALSCTATTAVLGAAGTNSVWRDFPNAPRAGTWYSAALANTLAGEDLDGRAGIEEIVSTFNVNLGQDGCLTGNPFYLGLDQSPPAGQTDFSVVLMHELGHGLGFQALTSGNTGARIADETGEYPSQWEPFMLDTTTGKTWLDMTAAERAASARRGRQLVWTGPNATAATPQVLQRGQPALTLTSSRYPSLAGQYPVGEASFGPPLAAGAVRGEVARVIDQADGVGGLACLPLDRRNAAAVQGRIALVDRGSCTFVVKAMNAQNAGAIGVIVADNQAGSPPAGLGGSDPSITIPAVRITREAGLALKAVLPTPKARGVAATLRVDLRLRAGADALGRPMLHSPDPYQSGSSVSHWDPVASPSLLMEPFITPGLTLQVTPPRDLTLPLLKDIGWQ